MLLPLYGKITSPSGCLSTMATACSGRNTNVSRLSLGCFMSLTQIPPPCMSLRLSAVISSCRRVENKAKPMISTMGILPRRCLRKKATRRANSSCVGRRVRSLDFPITRSLRARYAASSSACELTGTPLSIRADLKAFESQITSLSTVAGRAVFARSRKWAH